MREIVSLLSPHSTKHTFKKRSILLYQGEAPRCPAIIVVNVLHYVMNHFVDVYVTHDVPALTLRQRAEQMRAHVSKL